MSIYGNWDIKASSDVIGTNPIQPGSRVEITAGSPSTFTAYDKNGGRLFSIPVTVTNNTLKGSGTDVDNYYVTASFGSVGGVELIGGTVLKKTGSDDDGGQWDGNRR